MNRLIKARRKELGLTLEEIGSYVGVSKGTVQRWETGGISNMRRDKIKKLSEILQMDSHRLLTDGQQPEEDKNIYAKIPLLGTVAAGVPVDAQQDIIGWEAVPLEWTKDSTLFALKLKGDGMEPRMAAGDVVIVKKQSDVDSGQIAIVMVEDDAICRKVIKHGDGIALVSGNAKYSPVFFTAEEIRQKNIAVLGRVIELRVKF